MMRLSHGTWGHAEFDHKPEIIPRTLKRKAPVQDARIELLNERDPSYETVLASFLRGWKTQPPEVVHVYRVIPGQHQAERFAESKRLATLTAETKMEPLKDESKKEKNVKDEKEATDISKKEDTGDNRQGKEEKAHAILGSVSSNLASAAPLRVSYVTPSAVAFHKNTLGVVVSVAAFTSRKTQRGNGAPIGQSHHYNGGTEYSYEGHRAMLMAQLVKGRAARVEHGDSALEGAPPGYHCVLGVSGTTLNEEDYITYRDYSALPSYLFIYKHTS
ncbi:hypothetical protein PROFUN_07205 [Planoprotostelium fungivorum]|uniref:PARP catalytic domain-containing protein n=1 Tax=Planoprotostelium fungivorum TaxID=1890364 RepID=A0A2P6NME0_9EUKA|nr:hypothetical protein PROFUN_07205 [Planoprotostelium fungivorum]